jgi:hypothetical protein
MRTHDPAERAAGPRAARGGAGPGGSLPPTLERRPREGPLTAGEVLLLQRTIGNRAVGRILAQGADAAVQRKFYEYNPSDRTYTWHAEGPTAAYVPAGRKYSAPSDFFSWAVYVKREKSPYDNAFALAMLNTIYPGFGLVGGTVARQSAEEWGQGLQERGEVDEPDVSGYTFGGARPPAERDVRIHRDREKIDTLIHELVHVNAKEDWEAILGKALNEGFTEVLAQHAMKRVGFTVTGHYTNIVPTVEKLAARVGMDVVAAAYFRDGVETLDRALQAKHLDLVEICGHLNHHYTRVWDIPVAPLSLDDLGIGELVVTPSVSVPSSSTASASPSSTDGKTKETG